LCNTEESREKEEEFRRIKHKKEDVGVELYASTRN
jgi:hypothetical protein